MTTLEQQLADAIAAQNALTQTVAGKIGAINATVAAKMAQVDQYLAAARGEYPMPPNLVANSYMTSLDATTGIPVGFSAGGVAIRGVSAFTKGFEGMYTQAKPANAAATPDEATSLNPYWYGTYWKGPRLARGGLADGWSGTVGFEGLGEGHILKMTALPSGKPIVSFPSYEPLNGRVVWMPSSRLAATDRLGFRCYLKLVKGSVVGFGVDSGVYGLPQGTTFTKAQLDAGDQGWYFIDVVIPTSQVTVPSSTNNFSIGFRADEEIEAYMALPYIYVPAGARPGVVNS